jgi:hypothetical protein
MGDVEKYGHFFDKTRKNYDNNSTSKGIKKGSRKNGNAC